MRKRIIAGNWKMHGSREEAQTLLNQLKSNLEHTQEEIIVFPSFIHLPLTESILKNSNIKWGAQNLYIGKSGAFTGEISATMLKDYGCKYVLIGHSERRHVFNEDLNLIAQKFKAAQDANLIPILCVGETLQQREQQKTNLVIQEQIVSILTTDGANPNNMVIAYEPVWAIGTGKTATPEQAQEVHAFIRQLLAKHDANLANKMQILYGGSVKADNAPGLFAMPDIDGALVGGASLDAEGFTKICQSSTLQGA